LNATGAVGGDISGADFSSGNIGGGGVVGENTHEYPYRCADPTKGAHRIPIDPDEA